MKSLLCGLLTISILATPTFAASTDTAVSPIVIAVKQEPVEARVVELHITLANVPVSESTKRWRRLQKAGKAICSGGFVTPYGDIITAKHCAEGVKEIEVITHDGAHYTGTFVAMSKIHDLALIHIDRMNTPYFRIAEDAERGEAVYLLGSPLGITDTLSQGVIAKLDGDITLLDAGVLPGNSGGVVFNQRGELVGVATAGFVVMLGMTHLNLAQSANSVLFFLLQTLGGK